MKNYLAQSIVSQQPATVNLWKETLRRLDIYFIISIVFLTFSILFYTVVLVLIDNLRDIHFAQLDMYGQFVEMVIDWLLYLQMIVACFLLVLYTYRMDDNIKHETFIEENSMSSLKTTMKSILTQEVCSSDYDSHTSVNSDDPV